MTPNCLTLNFASFNLAFQKTFRHVYNNLLRKVKVSAHNQFKTEQNVLMQALKYADYVLWTTCCGDAANDLY